MALAINIEDLLNKQKIESNRIEFKKGWNPASIYHSVCAFANDFDDLGGGYILVGVDNDDDTGMAIRPVEGVPVEKIDGILQEMVGYNNKMSPYYMPRTSVEEVDGKQVLVIWCPAGINRPYCVPENVTAKNGSKEYFYIRSGTSSIIAKGEVLDELRELANRIPFDERGNPDIKLEDISTLLLREYLVKVGSKLANELYERPLSEILEQMDLYVGPSENRMLRNVAAMMFCENPSKFFKRTQVEVVFFPEGRLVNPNNIYEAPIITGSVTQIIERTLEYLNRMVVMQTIIKPKNDNHSIKFYTYPYQALEESITNSLYHRDYREWEPVVITVEPKGITIQNVGGPDRSIPSADINRGELLISKRYRNRRLGEYLKELELTEGRSTGIPTIHCHEGAGNIIADIATREKTPDSSQEVDKNIPDILKDVLKDVQKDVLKELSERQIVILELICTSPEATLTEMSRKLKVSDKTIQREFTAIRKLGINIERQDGRKEGKWVIKIGK